MFVISAMFAIAVILSQALCVANATGEPIYPLDRGDTRRSNASPMDPSEGSLGIVSMEPSGYYYGELLMGENDTLYLATDWGLQAMMPNGEVLWNWNLSYSRARAGIAPDGTLRVFSSSSVVSLSPNGSEIWNHSVPGLNLLLASPLIDGDGTVYGAIDNRSASPGVESGIVAIDSQGNIKWKFNAEGQASGGIAISNDGILVFASSSYKDDANRLYAIYPNGTMKWERDIAYNWMGTDLSIGEDGRIYVQESDNNILAIDPNGTLLWSYNGTNPFRPAAVGDRSIITANDNQLICLNFDGIERWKFNTTEQVRGFMLTKSGSVLFITNTGLGCVYNNGTLDFYTEIIHPQESDESWLYNPIIDEDGSIYLLYFSMGSGSYLVHVGQPTVRSDVAATAWMFTILCMAAIAAAISASAILVVRAYRQLRRKDEDKVLHPHLLWVATGLRILGVIIALIAVSSVWRYYSPAYSGFYLDPLYGYKGVNEFDTAQLYVLLFELGFLICVWTWYGAYLGFAGLIAYSAFLTEQYNNGILVWQADLNGGLPYGDGFVLAWAAILMLFISGILRMLARTTPWNR